MRLRPEDTITTGVKSYTMAQLTAKTRRAGLIARVTDDARGIWEDTGTFWKKLIPWVDVKDFGAIGDGTTDDTTAILNAWGAAQTSGRELYFGPGTFKITDDSATAQTYGILYSSSYTMHIRGAGRQLTVIKNGGSLGALLRLNGEFSSLSDLTLDNNGSTGIALQTFAQHPKVHDVHIKNQGGASTYAWYIDGATLLDLENVSIYDSTNGLQISKVSGSPANYLALRQVTISVTSGRALSMYLCSGLRFQGLHLEPDGAATNLERYITVDASEHLDFNGLSIETSTTETLTDTGHFEINNSRSIHFRGVRLNHYGTASKAFWNITHTNSANITIDGLWVTSAKTGMTVVRVADNIEGLSIRNVFTNFTNAATGINNVGSVTGQSIEHWQDNNASSSHTIDALSFLAVNVPGNMSIVSRADQVCINCPGTISGTAAATITQIGSNPTSLLNTARIKATFGTALVAGDIALSAGWGTTASVSAISGTDQRFRFTITSAGTGQGTSPTATLTFKNGTWTAAPYAVCSRNGGNQAAVLPTWTTTATTVVITFPGTPIAAETFTFECMVIG